MLIGVIKLISLNTKNLIKENKLNFYLLVPLDNLKKAIFKYNPSNNLNDSLIKKIMFFLL